MSIFDNLNKINVNGHTEQKNGLTYLSWAWAWTEVKKLYPDATYTIYENSQGWNYFTDGKTCWVKTGVTIEGLEHIEYLPVMDFKNKSIAFDNVTSFDVNKAIQRSLTKACARHGLGLYIYAGEDLPEEERQDTPQSPKLNESKKDDKILTKSEKVENNGSNQATQGLDEWQTKAALLDENEMQKQLGIAISTSIDGRHLGEWYKNKERQFILDYYNSEYCEPSEKWVIAVVEESIRRKKAQK